MAANQGEDGHGTAHMLSPSYLDGDRILDNEDDLMTDEQIIKRIHSSIKILRTKNSSNSSWSQEDEVSRVNIVCDILKIIHNSKSKTYGPSWKKRGWVVSIFGNIARKFDRLEKIFTDPSLVMKFVEKPDLTTNEESITDTFADSAVYSLLALTEVMVTKPEVFDQWFEKSFNVKIQK
jgi:hypothetical protein